MRDKKKIKKNDRIYFKSGNFANESGIITNIDWNSTDERAIFGFLHTVKLDNGKTVYIEKSEHWDYE